MEKNSPLTNELIGLEKKYWQAMQDHDLNAALDLTDFPCLLAGPQGARLVDRKQFEEMFESQKDNPVHVAFKDEPTVRLINENLAVIAYQVKADMTVKGKEQSLNAVDTSTWVRKSGKWACAHHTETPLQ
ncbi:MAG: nuclear transport factor 2 family protein [Bacteriovoracia bacterium]